jgi:hypothetical protein
VDFTSLDKADHLEVAESGITKVMTTTDRTIVATAAAFARRHSDEWIDSSYGVASEHYVTFYSGEKVVGVFGFGVGGITVGNYYQRVPQDELAELAQLLSVSPWPRPMPTYKPPTVDPK